jgi:hypothetical protein
VYATTGPRIAVRVFGGWDYTEADVQVSPIESVGYARGVPMGGEMPPIPDDPAKAAPRFLVHAMKDLKSGNLDRIQIVKGWIDAAGQVHERVFDVAWSDGRQLDANGQLPPVGNTVDASTASYTNEIGSASLSGVWRDSDFDPLEKAFYYVRVLEIPTPRHSTFDAVALGLDPEQLEFPWWIQERAYTSPIWYRP